MPEQQLPEIEEGDEQRRDAMLLKLLKTPPQPRKKAKAPPESVEIRTATASKARKAKPRS